MSQRGIGFKPFSRRLVERLAHGQRMGPGAYMYVVHRLTAILLTIYLYVHLVVLGSVLSGPDGFDRAMQMTVNPLVRLAELGLVWVVLFHALNGLRLMVVNLAPGANQRILAYAVVLTSLGIAVASLPLFLEVG